MDNNKSFLEEGKLIVKGMAKKTTESSLRDYFKNFGEVRQAVVDNNMNATASGGRKKNKRGPTYKLSGFVVFSNPKDIQNVLEKKHHKIESRDVKIEIADKLKIFVEGLPYIISEEAVTKCFQGCGKITNVQFDRCKSCVITFTSTKAVEKAVNLSPILLKGKLVNVKQAPEYSEDAAAVSPLLLVNEQAPEHSEGAAAVSPLLSLILFVKERIQDFFIWCHRVAGARPLPPWRNWMLKEERDFKPINTKHDKEARAAFAKAAERDDEIEGDNDEYIRIAPHDYLPPVDESLLMKLQEWEDKTLIEKLKDWNNKHLLKMLNYWNDKLDLEKWD